MTFNSVLNSLVTKIKDEPNTFNQNDLETIQDLIIGCTFEEVKSNAGIFATLCHNLTDLLISQNKSVIGVNLMTHAIQKLQTHATQLTSVHSDLCQLCLDSKCINPALDFLNVDYIDIGNEDDKFELKHVLMYHYYGGMIYAALKKFDRAIYFLETLLTLPIQITISNGPILLEAYKKYILLMLIEHGSVPENLLPKQSQQYIVRHRKNVGPAYSKLMHEYPSLNYDSLARLINGHKSIYEKDENYGLVKQCLKLVHYRNIRRLMQTFVTLSLSDVASHVNLPNELVAENYLLHMISQGEIFATINQSDGMVIFEESPETFDSEHVFKQLQSEMDECIGLINTLKAGVLAKPHMETSEKD